METLKLRYENGRFVPLTPISDIEEGQEIEVTYQAPPQGDYDAMLDRTRGSWSDLDEIEDFLADARAKWLQAWQDDQTSS